MKPAEENKTAQLTDLIRRRAFAYHKHKREFQRIFKVPLSKYMPLDQASLIIGFDIVRFDDEVVKSGDESMKDKIIRVYGEDAAKMIEELI